jgi:hypothetical protein
MIKISERSLAYIYEQKGELQQFMRRDGSEIWFAAYIEQLEETADVIDRYCPFPRHVLDIGSGLGGIDVLLMRRYACHVTMIDGEESEPGCDRHNIPFCSRGAVVAFMEDNCITPDAYDYCHPGQLASGPFDLVISLRSWLFHYGPEQYLDYVLAETKKGALLMVDVRRSHPHWLVRLHEDFARIAVVAHNDKCERMLFQRR